jgi:desulfoferrodoxin (superoxide reductase-like protein)
LGKLGLFYYEILAESQIIKVTMKRQFLILGVLFALSLVDARANKTSVEIKASTEVKAGTEVTITVNVMHSGNSRSHHTEWVYLKINGKEAQQWSYTKENLPPDANFTVEYKIIVNEDLNIEAEGNCNIHGTKGAQTLVIKAVK